MKDITGAVTKSPVIEKSLAVAKVVAVPALPVKSPVNVVAVIAPETFTSSNSVCPSISTLPLKSATPVNVDTPETIKSSVSVSPVTSIPPDLVASF